MDQCFYCGETLFNSERYVIRTKDTKFQGRKRYQNVGYCCLTCEGRGCRTQYAIEEWRAMRDAIQGATP